MRQLYGPQFEIVTWQAAPIGEQTPGLSGGLFRVSGTAEGGSAWSVVFKVLRPVAPAFLTRFSEADHKRLEVAYLWDREARLYESGLLNALPDGFSAPRCIGSLRTDETCWLWFDGRLLERADSNERVGCLFFPRWDRQAPQEIKVF